MNLNVQEKMFIINNQFKKFESIEHHASNMPNT